MKTYMTQGLYSKKHLLQALREAGLPCSYPTLVRYEKEGIVSKPAGMVGYMDREWRFYTQEEIEQVLAAVKAHVEASEEKVNSNNS